MSLASGSLHFVLRYHDAPLISKRGPQSWDGRGTVDWQLLLAILIVISLNIHDSACQDDHHLHVLHPVGLPSSRPYSAPGSSHRDPLDWVGITGNWRHLVSFCDYHDLEVFNASTSFAL